MNSLKRSLTTVVTLLVLAVAVFGIRWLVTTQRSPGAITVIEAQAMDMAEMKAPPGVLPVTTAKPVERSVGARQEFPATVMAFSDEEIVARVPGKVISLAYPGDHIQAGQSVASIDAAEYLAQARKAQFDSDAARAQSTASQRQTDLLRVSRTRIQADSDAAKLMIARAIADKAQADQELQKIVEEGEAKKAEVKARQADLTYADQSVQRFETLYRQGYTSLDRFQVAERARDKAKADLDAAQSEQSAKEHSANAARARVLAMQQEIARSMAQAKSARLAVSEADKAIAKSVEDLSASKFEAQASGSQTESAATIAGYTQLRALDNCMVSERYVSPGSVVTAGQKLLMLHMADKVRIQAQLPESLAGRVAVGAPMSIRYGGSVTQARVTSIFPTADSSTRTFTAEALIDNPSHRFLPGSFAAVSLQTGSASESLAVPTAALQTDSAGKAFVWVVAESKTGAKTDWTCPMHTEVSEPGPGKCPICKMELVPRSRGGKTIASRRAVTIGATDGTFTAVTGDLKAEDEVILDGFQSLIEGTPVKVGR